MKRSRFLRLRYLLPTTLLSLLLMGAAPGADSVQAREPVGRGGGFGRASGRAGDLMARRLDLTDAQREAMTKLREEGRARDVPLRKQMQQLRNELKGEMLKDDPSDRTVTDLARQMGELRTRMQTGRLQDRLAMRKLLTPEQRDKLILMGEGRRGGERGRGGMHGGRRGGWNGRGGGGRGCDGTGPGPRHRQRDRDPD